MKCRSRLLTKYQGERIQNKKKSIELRFIEENTRAENTLSLSLSRERESDYNHVVIPSKVNDRRGAAKVYVSRFLSA